MFIPVCRKHALSDGMIDGKSIADRYEENTPYSAADL